MKILIVDDCPTTRKLLSLYLTTWGYEVECAENGLDALEKAGAGAFGMIITDLNMPYMDGIELVRTIRKDPAQAAVPVLVVTTEQEPKERDAAMAAGADGYLVKPVTAEALMGSVRGMLGVLSPEEGSAHA
jgi:two-component system, chemotaxis family, chemotaxis protein CheY